MNTWTDVAAEAELFEGAGIAFVVEGREIAVFKLDNSVYAIDNICSHGSARLCDGFVDGYAVECPFHQAQFSLHDGSVLCGPATEAMKCWPIKIEDSRVYVNLTESTTIGPQP